MKVLLRLLGFLRPYWWQALIVVGLMLGLTSVRLAPAWLTKVTIDEAIPSGRLRDLVSVVLALLGAHALVNALQSIQGYLDQYIGQRVVYDLRDTLYRQLQSQSMSFYDANQTGQLMSRVTNDVSMVQMFVTRSMVQLLSMVSTMALNLAILLMLNWHLTLVALVAVPVIAVIQQQVRKIMPLFRTAYAKQAELSAVLQENIIGIKLVKAYGAEAYEAERFNDKNWEMRQIRLRAVKLMAIFMPVMEVSTAGSTVLILTLGAMQVIDGQMSIGELVAFQMYVAALWGPIRTLGFFNQMSQQAMAAGERIFEIIDTPLDVQEQPDSVALPPLRGSVSFRNVAFAYRQGEPLLQGISFDLPPGHCLALVGPSGSGKSTVINLVPRFYDVTSGKVLVDGCDIRHVTLESLRSQIGMVMQETFLFNLTVRENIRYGRPDATDEEIEAAARAAYAHDFIMELPEGYDTPIGEKGTRLSGGQRQRVAIARALVVNPRLLILDEATSSVDTRTDYQIQRALDNLLAGRTTIIIAHRLSTVQRADEILLLESGRIVARGTHQQLLATSEHYRRLYDIQFKLQTEGTEGTEGTGGVDGRFHRRPASPFLPSAPLVPLVPSVPSGKAP